MDKILWCDHSNETSSAALSHGTIFYYEALTFDYVNEILWGDHSNATSLAVFSHGTIHLVCSSNFWVCGPDPVQLPVVLTHSTIFAVSICSYNFGVWYHLSSTLSYNFWVLRWNPMAHYGSFKRNTLKWSFSIFSFCTSGTLWTDIFANYSSSPSGLWDILTQRPRVREE